MSFRYLPSAIKAFHYPYITEDSSPRSLVEISPLDKTQMAVSGSYYIWSDYTVDDLNKASPCYFSAIMKNPVWHGRPPPSIPILMLACRMLERLPGEIRNKIYRYLAVLPESALIPADMVDRLNFRDLTSLYHPKDLSIGDVQTSVLTPARVGYRVSAEAIFTFYYDNRFLIDTLVTDVGQFFWKREYLSRRCIFNFIRHISLLLRVQDSKEHGPRCHRPPRRSHPPYFGEDYYGSLRQIYIIVDGLTKIPNKAALNVRLIIDTIAEGPAIDRYHGVEEEMALNNIGLTVEDPVSRLRNGGAHVKILYKSYLAEDTCIEGWIMFNKKVLEERRFPGFGWRNLLGGYPEPFHDLRILICYPSEVEGDAREMLFRRALQRWRNEKKTAERKREEQHLDWFREGCEMMFSQ